MQFTRKSMVEPILISSLVRVAVSTKGRTAVSLNWNMKPWARKEDIIIILLPPPFVKSIASLSLFRVSKLRTPTRGWNVSSKTIASIASRTREREENKNSRGKLGRSEFFIANIIRKLLLSRLKDVETNEGKKMLN